MTSTLPADVTDQAGAAALADQIGKLRSEMESAFTLMDYAEDEIASAIRRHPDHADRLWHSFQLLTPTLDDLGHEVVYRAHCRELLNRVTLGEDTRPATAAECCVALMRTSLTAPLTAAAFGLYLRLWACAELPDLGLDAQTREHYEALHGTLIDDREQWLRTRLRHNERVMPAQITHVQGCPHPTAQ